MRKPLCAGRHDLARLAIELGYFDQAHFANDLAELAGTTPGRLAAEVGSISPIASVFGEAESPSVAPGTFARAAEESRP